MADGTSEAPSSNEAARGPTFAAQRDDGSASRLVSTSSAGTARMSSEGTPSFIPEREYNVLALVGSGAFGEVYRAVEVGTDRLVAIKRIAFDLIPEEIEDVMKEVTFLSTTSHPNVVRYIHSFLTPLVPGGGTKLQSTEGHLLDEINSVCIVQEWVNGGSIAHLYQTTRTRLTEEEIFAVVYDILQALRYVHEDSCLIHRDIKCSNLLIDLATGSIKLSDFGACGKVEGYNAARYTLIGTPGWMAPEMTSQISGGFGSGMTMGLHRYGSYGFQFPHNGHGFATDIWSLGISILEMIYAAPPTAEYRFSQSINRLSNLNLLKSTDQDIQIQSPYDHEYSKDLKHFVASCLVRNPSLRPTAKDLLRHTFIERHLKKVNRNDVLKRLRVSSPAAGDIQSIAARSKMSQHTSVSALFGNTKATGKENAGSMLVQHPSRLHTAVQQQLAATTRQRFSWQFPHGLDTVLLTDVEEDRKEASTPELSPRPDREAAADILFQKVIVKSIEESLRQTRLNSLAAFAAGARSADSPSTESRLAMERILQSMKTLQRKDSRFSERFCENVVKRLVQCEDEVMELTTLRQKEKLAKLAPTNYHSKPIHAVSAANNDPSKRELQRPSRLHLCRMPEKVATETSAYADPNCISATAYLYNQWRDAKMKH
jgi:serine/threonine protein kinase